MWGTEQLYEDKLKARAKLLSGRAGQNSKLSACANLSAHLFPSLSPE